MTKKNDSIQWFQQMNIIPRTLETFRLMIQQQTSSADNDVRFVSCSTGQTDTTYLETSTRILILDYVKNKLVKSDSALFTIKYLFDAR